MNNKRLHWVFMVGIAFFLVSCSGLQVDDTAGPLPPTSTAAPSPAPTYTAIPLDSQLPTRTPVPDTPTPEPTNTPTTSPTPTRAPQVVWSDSFPLLGSLEALNGNWSSTANEYIFSSGNPLFDLTSALKLAAAPDFQPITITTLTDWGAVIWALDGKEIYCLGCTTSEIPYQRILKMSKDGSQINVTCPDITPTTGYLWFGGWLDMQNLVIQNYSGGGTVVVEICNTQTGEKAAWKGDIKGRSFSPRNGYIPAFSEFIDDPHLLVISKQFPSASPELSTLALGNIAMLPEYADVPRLNTISLFEDWRPYTNQILAYWASSSDRVYSNSDPQLLNSHLLLWNVDTNSLSLAAPNAKGGRFSPDGAWLAYLTDGPASMDTARSPISGEKNPDTTLPDYMQLLEMANGKVWFSLPVLSSLDNDDIIFETHARLNAEFSPDNRFLAFLTPGEIQVEEDFDLTIAPEAIDPANVRLNLVDLQGRMLVQAFTASETSNIVWSPVGNYLAFQDQAQNWQILDLESLAILPLTNLNGEYVEHIQWSYDGHYLSARVCLPAGDSVRDCKINIFDIASTMER